MSWMMHGIRLRNIVLVFVLALCCCQRRNHGVTITYSCPIKLDFSTTETTLRSFIFLAKTEQAAKVLGRNETFSLGAGLQFLEEQRCAVVASDNPRRDPDIVAIQALALSAKFTKQTVKLANAIVLSFEPRCACSLFTSERKDELVDYWKGILEDPLRLEEILSFGAERKQVPSPVSETHTGETQSDGHRRLLQGRQPPPTFVCGLCRPRNVCREMEWCSSASG